MVMMVRVVLVMHLTALRAVVAHAVSYRQKKIKPGLYPVDNYRLYSYYRVKDLFDEGTFFF
jgi:hypothetical protein